MNKVCNKAHKTPVLTALKLCVKNIENEVGELKNYLNEITLDSTDDENKVSFYSEKSNSIKKEINYLLHDGQKLKSSMNTNIKTMKFYYLDMEDLVLDIENEIEVLEEHLINYGYKPSGLDTSDVQESQSEADSSYNESEDQILESDLSLTPQFDISSISFPQKRSKEPVNEETVENASPTPELKVEVIPVEKKTRHVLSSPIPLPLGLGSASKLGDVARKLYF